MNMDSDQQQQLQSLTDFWKEPWTASTWETWSNQNPAYQGLQPSSWMYTSHASKHVNNDSLDFDFGSFSSDGTSVSASSSIPSPETPPPEQRHQQQQWANNNSSSSSNSSITYTSNGQLVEHHHHHHHHHGGSMGALSPSSVMTPMSSPPGLPSQQQQQQMFGQPATSGGGGLGNHSPHHALAVHAARAIGGGAGGIGGGGGGGRVNSSRSSSIDSDSSALGLFGSGGGPCAFQIPGYRTVELMPTAQQRQTLQKWFGVVRWTHNRAVDALRVDPTASATSLRAAVAESEAEHEWAAAVPLAIRDATVAQLVGALHLAKRSAEVAAAATGEVVAAEPIGTAAQNKALKYRTRKDRLEQVVLRADGFQYGIPYPDYFGYAPLATSAPIPDRLQTDAILVRSTERFYLCIPESR